jgi:pyruvate dehydrogenase E2 component (dihydrolipoamide acetyltransferase)
MIHEVFMPALSSTMTEGKIVSWEKAPGDKVEKGETVLIVESDKADMDVESFYSGYLATIIVPAGGTAPVGEAIAFLAETEAEIEAAKQKAKNLSQPAASSSPTPASAPAPKAAATSAPAAAVAASVDNGRTVASPRAKKLAKELKVNLDTLKGSGPHGRIVAEDVEAAAGLQPAAVVATPVATPVVSPVAPVAPVAAVAPSPVPTVTRTVTPVATPAPSAPGQVVPLNTLQKAVVANMNASLEMPVFRVGYTIMTDNLDRIYKQLKPKGVTMTALLAKAVANTLQKHPIMNASYRDGAIAYSGAINIAVGVAMPDGGLITPVLQNADQLDIYSLSRVWQDLVERARAKKLQPPEYNSGTFSISNLGMFGVDRFDAVLSPGQGAIMAIGASRPQVVATDDGMFGVKRLMQVNVTCDHRVIYGAHTAAFLQDLAQLIETKPESLTM